VRLATALYRRFQVLVHEMAKFGVVGAINTVVHFGLFNLLHLRYGWGPLTSNGIAIAVAATSSYYMNRHWTFRHRARTGAGREYSLFFLLNGVGWIISQACVAITTYVLDLTGAVASNGALVVGVALGMGFRFATYKRWVFLPLDGTEPDEVAAEMPGGPAGANGAAVSPNGRPASAVTEPSGVVGQAGPAPAGSSKESGGAGQPGARAAGDAGAGWSGVDRSGETAPAPAGGGR
jgi:putative flippase GtrA